MRDRLVFLLAGAAGSQVKVTLKNGHQYVGILASAIIESEFGTILHRVKKIHPPEQDPEIKPTLIFAAKDVKALETVSEIDLCARVEPLPPPVQGANVPLNSSDSFRTDVQITGSAADGSQRVLQSWADDIPLDDNTADLMQSSGSGGKAWDQFAANEKLFGVRSNYNEELYTTKLDRTGKDFKEREKQADKLAKEIMSVS